MRDGDVVGGRFRLDRQIGRGGFARVFLATDLTLERQVALKLLHAELLARDNERDFLQRFRREARAVAALDQPNILGIHDYGEAAGEVYLVMPYVAGGTLHARLDAARPLDPPLIGRYLREIAAALDYAHARGIVHRDVKPQNILLAGDGRALLADFGVAKVLGDAGQQTQTGAIGTITYMAPEQFGGQISPALDIYALGCVLFQLLTGRTPYTSPAERIIFSHINEPIPTLASAGAGARVASFQPVIAGALQKNPAARYATAGALARAFDQILAGLDATPPRDETAAHAATLVGPSPPFARNTPTPASGAAQAGAIPFGVRQGQTPAAQAASPGVTALSAGDLGRSSAAQGTGGGSSAIPSAGAPARRRARLPLLVAGGALVLIAVLALGGFAMRQGGVVVAPRATIVGQLDVRPETPTLVAAQASASPASGPTSVAGPGVATPRGSATPARSPLIGETVVTFTGHTDHLRGLTWAPDGQTLVSSSGDGSVRFWRADGTLIRTISGRTFAVTSVAFSPDGTLLAIGADGKSDQVQLWRADGTLVATLVGHTDNVTLVAWSPDGRTLATASTDKTVRLWSSAGEPLRALTGHTNVVQNVTWSPDSQRLISASWDRTLRLWRLDGSLVTTLTGHTDQVYGVAWSPDGGTIASASRDKTVRLWRADGTALATLTGHTSFVSAVAWSPDGRTLASSGFDNTIRLWSAAGDPLATLTGHTDAVNTLAWRPDGKALASGSWDRTIRLWR